MERKKRLQNIQSNTLNQFSLSSVRRALWWTSGGKNANGEKRTTDQKQFQHHGHGQLPVELSNMIKGCEVT